MKAIIFGANGQDGHYLVRLFLERGIEPIGVSRSGDFVRGDVADFALVEKLVREHSPAYVLQMAAASTTSHDALFENHAAIATGAINVLEAVKRHAPAARVFIPGSGVQFVNIGKPIKETDPFEASSPYSIARIQSVYAARYYRSLGIRTFVGYLFHHESPLRKPHHVSMKVVQAARRIAGGSKEILELGDISVRKEWAFAGDIVEGMLALMEQDQASEAMIGSGIVHSIEDWLEAVFGLLGLEWREHVRTQAGFQPEYKALVSDTSVMHGLGWRVKLGLKELARLMLEA
ncbi:MAG: GDP-mannose 4,6-dehydratase [Planctomycetota bacterium]|nr:GDP-mannose 4,6-dehydratase [Planctomycetota bacterium]